MTISIRAQKMLWGRGASRCAICQLELVMDAAETDDEALVGENCHIVAREPNGPRGESDLTTEQRDRYRNLILLCNVHHKQIDDLPEDYPVERLEKIKSDHEAFVRTRLAVFDEAKQRDDERYAAYVDEWEARLDVNNWNNNWSWVLSHGQPSICKDYDKQLSDSRQWLLSRVWPGRYESLESAFANFRRVLQDFQNTFHEHVRDRGDGYFEVEKFYKIDQWDEGLYRTLADKFHYHVGLVSDLALEVTRAANYVCDQVREKVVRSYRLDEGVLLIQSGPHSDLTFRTYRTEYRGDERTDAPYPGLEAFEEERKNRDISFF